MRSGTCSAIPFAPALALSDKTATPGAETSIPIPKFEKAARTSSGSVAATASTSFRFAGEMIATFDVEPLTEKLPYFITVGDSTTPPPTTTGPQIFNGEVFSDAAGLVGIELFGQELPFDITSLTVNGIVVTDVFIFADPEDVGMSAARACGECYAAAGRDVTILSPPDPRRDWNDVLRRSA